MKRFILFALVVAVIGSCAYQEGRAAVGSRTIAIEAALAAA